SHVPDTTSNRGSGGVAMPGAAAHPAPTPRLHTHLVPTTDVDSTLQIGLIALPYDPCDLLVRVQFDSLLPQALQKGLPELLVIGFLRLDRSRLKLVGPLHPETMLGDATMHRVSGYRLPPVRFLSVNRHTVR